MTLRAVVLDFDGTLFTLRADWPAMRAALAGVTDRAARLALVERFELAGVRAGAPVAGARELVAGLRARGLRAGILTRNCAATVRAAFAEHALPAPDALVALDDEVSPKPHPDALALLLARLGVEAHQALYVGDTWHDMEAAARHGMRRVLRFNPELEWAPVELAHHVVRELGEVLELLDQ